MKRPADSRLRLRLTWLATTALGRFSTRLGGAAAERLWFTPWTVPLTDLARARRARWLDVATPRPFELGGRRLTGFEAGSGPTVLLVHGWGDSAAGLGAFAEPLVEAGCRVVGVDFPAHGGSPGRTTNGLEMAMVVQAIADEIGDVRAVIAHSLGAVATGFALREDLAPDRVVLLAPAVKLETALARFVGMFRLPPRAIAGLRTAIERRFGASVWAEWDLTRQAMARNVPALIVQDRDDAQAPLEDAEKLARSWPGSRLDVTEGLGHSRILRDPDVIERVVSFLGESREDLRGEPRTETVGAGRS